MDVTVLGSNGFIGSHLCRLLVQKGYKVRATVRKTSDLSLLKRLNPNLEGLKIVYGDVTDRSSLRRVLEGTDAVINLAAVLKGYCQEQYDRVNVYGTLNVCAEAEEQGIKKIVLTSSLAGFGGGREKEVTEDDPPAVLPGDYYGISKYRMERAVKRKYGHLPITIVRPPVVLGPGDIPSLDLFRLPKMGLKLVVGTRPLIYSVVYVKDLVEGFAAVLENPRAEGEAFFFTTGKPVDWGSLQELIGHWGFGRKYGSLITIVLPPSLSLMLGSLADLVGRLKGEALFLNRGKMIEGMHSWYCSRRKAEKLLGWKPRHTLKTMIQETVKWYTDNGWL